jgi:hypothetical protein
MEISPEQVTNSKKAGILLIRKNVSLDEDHLQKLQPLLEKNGGNLSAAIRESNRPGQPLPLNVMELRKGFLKTSERRKFFLKQGHSL